MEVGEAAGEDRHDPRGVAEERMTGRVGAGQPVRQQPVDAVAGARVEHDGDGQEQ